MLRLLESFWNQKCLSPEARLNLYWQNSKYGIKWKNRKPSNTLHILWRNRIIKKSGVPSREWERKKRCTQPEVGAKKAVYPAESGSEKSGVPSRKWERKTPEELVRWSYHGAGSSLFIVKERRGEMHQKLEFYTKRCWLLCSVDQPKAETPKYEKSSRFFENQRWSLRRNQFKQYDTSSSISRKTSAIWYAALFNCNRKAVQGPSFESIPLVPEERRKYHEESGEALWIDGKKTAGVTAETLLWL